MSYRVIGTVQFPDDVMHARVEVCTWSQQAEGIKGGVIYLSKFRSGQLGERSVGMSAHVARQAAALLTQAAKQIEANAKAAGNHEHDSQASETAGAAEISRRSL